MGETECPLTQMIANLDDTVQDYIDFLEFFFHAPNDDVESPKQFYYYLIAQEVE